VSVGRGFLVAGSVAGIPATGQARADGVCEPLDLDVRDRARISMDAPSCGDVVPDNTFDSRCDPDLPGQCNPATSQGPAQKMANDLQSIQRTPNVPNPCLYIGGPYEADPFVPDLQHHVRALFRNREVQFIVANLERPPSGVFQMHFDVHGGFQPQIVAIPGTVEVAMPARLILGPFDSAVQTGTPGTATSEVPYLFVVDQRRLGRSQGGGPTRGQLLRINPRGLVIATPVAGAQPWFEDLAHSGNLFPMQ
jgi:hypothetical protein